MFDNYKNWVEFYYMQKLLSSIIQFMLKKDKNIMMTYLDNYLLSVA